MITTQKTIKIIIFNLIGINLFILLLFSCKDQNKNNYYISYVNSTQQIRIIDSLKNALLDKYIYPEKAKIIAAHLDSFKTEIKSSKPKEFVLKVNEILYEHTQDKHLNLHYDTTFTRSLIYKNMIGSKWNDRKYFEAYLQKDKDLVNKNFDFEKIEVLPGNVGYFKFNHFPTIGDGQETFESALNFLRNVDALIIDLRSNRGGSLAMAESISSYFFEGGTTLFYRHYIERSDTVRYYADKIEEFRKFKKMPLFILVGENTSSAAEIFTNVMKEKVRGRVIGSTTWGGAHVCNYQVLNEAFSILIPSSQILGVHSLNNWEAKGIKPHNIYTKNDIINYSHILAVEQLMKKEKNNYQLLKLSNLNKLLHNKGKNKKLNLNKYTGEFGPYQVFIKNEKLKIKFGRKRASNCISIGNDEFIVENSSFSKMKFINKGLFGFKNIYIINKNGDKLIY